MDKERLEELLDNGEMPETNEFRIDSDSMADWALKKIAALREERDRVVSIGQAEIDEIKSKMDKVVEREKSQEAFLMFSLGDYFGKVAHQETKTQETYKLLHGSLVLKKAATKMVVPDDENLVSYLRMNDMSEFIKTKETPNWAELKKNLSIDDGRIINTITGEVVEDVVACVETPASFDIKVAK